MEGLLNKTSIVFNSEFKEKISKIKETGLPMKLNIPAIKYILEVQEEIRQYLKENYPELCRKMPDTFATFLCLIVDITHYTTWEDFDVPCLYIKHKYIYEEVRDCSCCCGHSVQASNSTIVENNELYLVLGDVCIEKYGIVHESESHLRKKRNLKKPIPKPSKWFKVKYTDVQEELCFRLNCKCGEFCRDTLCADCLKQEQEQVKRAEERRIQAEERAEERRIQDEERAELRLQLKKKEQDRIEEEAKKKAESCAVCHKPCPKFKKCFECKLKTEDKCGCGKWKDKKYPTCYSCKNIPDIHKYV